MGRILRVAQREYAETVKTKMFLVSVLFTPLLVAVMMIFMGRMGKSLEGPRPAKEIAVTDLSNEVAEELRRVSDKHNASHAEREIILRQIDIDGPGRDARIGELKEEVREGELDGYLVIAEDVLDGKGTCHFYTNTRNVRDIVLAREVERLVYDAVVNRRVELHDLTPELIEELRRGVEVEQVDVSGEGEKKRETVAVLMAPFFFMFLMFMGVSGASQGMLTSVIEEKNSRVM